MKHIYIGKHGISETPYKSFILKKILRNTWIMSTDEEKNVYTEIMGHKNLENSFVNDLELVEESQEHDVKKINATRMGLPIY